MPRSSRIGLCWRAAKARLHGLTDFTKINKTVRTPRTSTPATASTTAVARLHPYLCCNLCYEDFIWEELGGCYLAPTHIYAPIPPGQGSATDVATRVIGSLRAPNRQSTHQVLRKACLDVLTRSYKDHQPSRKRVEIVVSVHVDVVDENGSC